MYKRRRSAHAGQPCDSGCYTDQRVNVGMGAQGNAPMCRGLGCTSGRMTRRSRQSAAYPRLRAEVTGHYRSVPNSEHGKVWSRGDTPGESYIVTEGEDADIWIGKHRRG